MMGHKNYWKRNLSIALIESEGWTKDQTESALSRRINPDENLCDKDVIALHKTYGDPVRMVRDDELRSQRKS